MRVSKNCGLISYGVAIPRYRLRTSEVSRAWNKNGQERSLGVLEKAVAGADEDTITLAVEAAQQALSRLTKKPQIGAIYTGSESHPYAVKPSSATVGAALGISHDYTAADLEFACKAGTAGMQAVAGLVDSRMIESGLAIGADAAQSRPGDALEYTAAAGGAAFIIGSAKNQPIIARLLSSVSKTYDTPDFWRRQNQAAPSHGGRFTGEPAYFRLVINTVQDMLANLKLQIKDIDHVVLHMPNAKFPQTAAKRLGIKDNQLKSGLTVSQIGNSYSACSLIGFARVLDTARPGQKILLCSFGSGAGSDAFVWEVTSNITAYRRSKYFANNVQSQINNKEYIDYVTYCRFMRKLRS